MWHGALDRCTRASGKARGTGLSAECTGCGLLKLCKSLEGHHATAGAGEKHPRKDLNRRTSSGNWIEDRVTWKEELNYKKAMGYL